MKAIGLRTRIGLICLMLMIVCTSANALEIKNPCVSVPYDYQYEDDKRFIAINKFSENGITYFVADVQIAGTALFQTALSGDKPNGSKEKLSTMASRYGAVLAINSDDYGTHKYGTIIRNGLLIRTNETTRNMLIVDAEANLSVRVDRADEDPAALGQQLIDAGTLHTFEFGPELVRDGQAVTFSEDFDLISTSASRREPRTAIGQIEPLHYIIIVADGRQDGYSKGMTLQELQQLFVRYGAQTAMNLDGGASTTLWFNGEIINSPSRGKERGITDMIFF